MLVLTGFLEPSIDPSTIDTYVLTIKKSTRAVDDFSSKVTEFSTFSMGTLNNFLVVVVDFSITDNLLLFFRLKTLKEDAKVLNDTWVISTLEVIDFLGVVVDFLGDVVDFSTILVDFSTVIDMSRL